MISPSEDVIPLAQVANHLPPAMARSHVSTCIRWALRGVGNPPIRLETLKIGGRRLTSVQAIDRFITALSCEIAPHKPTSNAKREAEQRAANDECEAEQL